MDLLNAPQLVDKLVQTKNEWLLTVEDAPGVFFTKCSELKEMKEPSEYYDGLSNRKRFSGGGTLSVEPVTLAVPFSIVDMALMSSFVDTFRDGSITDVSLRVAKFSQTLGIVPLPARFFLGNCRFNSYSPFDEIDRSSSEVAETTLVLNVEYFTIRN